MNEPAHELPKQIGKPATNALLSNGITTLSQVEKLADTKLLALHGMGPKAVRILRETIFKTKNT